MRVGPSALTPREAAAALGNISLPEILGTKVEEYAAFLCADIKENLSNVPGDDHREPWKRTGHLEESIFYSVVGLVATIGSIDPAAKPQELGTARVPPRPFVAPVAATAGKAITDDIGRTVVCLLKQRLLG